MYPLTIALAIETKELWEEVQACLQPLPCRVVVEYQDMAVLDAFLEKLQRMRPDVVLVDISKWKDPLEDLVRRVRSAAADAMIIAINASAEADAILAALRAGMNEYLFPPLQGTLRKALEKKSAEKTRRRERSGGKSIAFFSAKGGCGATTLACHVAVELGRQGQRVLLADLDLDAGMISFLLKTKSPYSILDALGNLHRLDASYWKALVSNGIPGVEIIPAPAAMGSKQQQAPRPDQLRHVLGFVRSQYDTTVVDLGRSLSRLTMETLEEIDEACLVSTLEVPALHQSKQIVQTLLDSGYGKSRLRLILNRVPKRVDITPEELEKMLGIPVHSMLPDEYPELYECYSEGRLLPRNSNLAKHIARVTSKLAGLDEDRGAHNGGKRLFGLFG